jgi:hypothetical protein
MGGRKRSSAILRRSITPIYREVTSRDPDIGRSGGTFVQAPVDRGARLQKNICGTIAFVSLPPIAADAN